MLMRGEPIYQVKGKIFSLHHTLVLMHSAGKELATVSKQIISLTPKLHITCDQRIEQHLKTMTSKLEPEQRKRLTNPYGRVHHAEPHALSCSECI